MRLKAIIRQYIQIIRPRAQAELNWFRQQPSLKAAVALAALAKNCEGKRYSHQRRLKKAALENAQQILLQNIDAIEQQSKFDDLSDLIAGVTDSISGLGELYVYDTSLRIAAKLHCLPTKVYLHAGARHGARTLGLDWKAKALEATDFPIELQQLEPHEIEDVLCIFFKDKFAGVEATQTEPEVINRSWCS